MAKTKNVSYSETLPTLLFFGGGGGGPTLYCLGHLRFFTFFLLLYFNNLQGFLSLEGITAKLTTYLTGLDKQKISA